jgi:hypothetical protein
LGTIGSRICNGLLALSLLLLMLLIGTANAHPKSATLHFTRSTNGWILIHAKVNGYPGVFLLDTGALDTFVSPALIGESNVGFKSEIPFMGGKGMFRKIPATVSLGDRDFRVDVLLGFIESLTVQAKTHIDGIIGLSVLGQYEKITVDLETRTLTLEERP